MITKIKTANHEEWLKLRSQYIGGSDAAAVIGLNPYKSPYALWAEKTGQTAPFGGNIATQIGTYLERFVAIMYSEKTGNRVRNDTHTYFNSDYPWACANVDRMITGKKAGLEIKTTNDRKKTRLLLDGKIPNDWLCQMTHYMAVTGLDHWELAALCENRELVILPLSRDEDDIAALMSAERSFWEQVKSREPPSVDGAASTAAALDAMYPDSEADSQVSLEPVAHYLSELLRLKSEKKVLEGRIRTAENVIKEYMGDIEYGFCGDMSVNWKTVSRITYDTKALCRDHPDIMEQYQKVSASRRFTAKRGI